MDLLCDLMDLGMLASTSFHRHFGLNLYFSFLIAPRVTTRFPVYLYLSNEFCLALDGLQDGMTLHFCGHFLFTILELLHVSVGLQTLSSLPSQ